MIDFLVQRQDQSPSSRLASLLAGIAGRLRTVLALAVIVAGCTAGSWLAVRFVAPLVMAEHWLQDLRVAGLSNDLQQDGTVALVTVDEDTLASLPYRSPVDRTLLSRTIAALSRKGVRAIGLDILLDRPTTPEADAALRRALAEATVPVIVAAIPAAAEPLGLIPSETGSTVGVASAAVPIDRIDGVVRRLPGRSEGDRPSLAEALAALSKPGLVLPGGPIAYRASPIAKPAPFPQYPAHAIDLIPADWLAGKTVLIGVDLTDFDRHRTPYVTTLGNKQGTLPGVAIHAHILSQLLDGRTIAEPGRLGGWLFTLAFAALASAMALANLPTAAKFALLGIAVATVLALAFLSYALWAVLLPILPGVLALLSTMIMAATLLGREDRRQRRRIREAFSRFVPAGYVRQLLADPRLLKLHGARQELTFLFSDVAGFTSLCERTRPEVFVPMMNEYLGGLGQIVTRHGGTIDKIVGDALVAMFGAPIPQPDHPQRAVACAQEIDRFGRAFQQTCLSRGIEFGLTRIGVNTGAATVGNFGGADRITYTAYGDAVNVAARLEAANKCIGTTLCVSAATASRCDGIALRPIGSATLPGVARPVAIFAPSGDAAREAPGDAYRAAFGMLERGEAGAAAEFAALRRQFPDDRLVSFHDDRCAQGCLSAEIIITKG